MTAATPARVPKLPSTLEIVAAQAVCSATGVQVDRFIDDGSTEGAVDWMLTHASGQRIALEVTRAASPALRAFWSKADHYWEIPDGHPGFHLARVTPESDRRRLHRSLPPLLPVFKAIGSEDMREIVWIPNHPLRESVKELNILGVYRTTYTEHPDGLCVISLVTGSGGAVAARSLVDAALAEVEANRAKAAAADSDTTHLFVAIDWSSEQAAMSASFDPAPPTTPIDLGSGVDSLWIAFPADASSVAELRLLWQYQAVHGWTDHFPAVRGRQRLDP